MELISTLNDKIKNSTFAILGSVLCVYFAYHAISGERGLIRLISLKQEISKAQRISDSFKIQKNNLEKKVKLLSSDSLDLDLLEERSRIVLNMAGEDEYIILDDEI
jgi:cell division protein FtsB